MRRTYLCSEHAEEILKIFPTLQEGQEEKNIGSNPTQAREVWFQSQMKRYGGGDTVQTQGKKSTRNGSDAEGGTQIRQRRPFTPSIKNQELGGSRIFWAGSSASRGGDKKLDREAFLFEKVRT